MTGEPEAAETCFELDGARVHGNPRMTAADKAALRDVIGAAKRFAESLPPTMEQVAENTQRTNAALARWQQGMRAWDKRRWPGMGRPVAVKPSQRKVGWRRG